MPEPTPPIWPIETIATADGARLAVKRRPAIDATPIVFLHGIAANADLWDMPRVQTAEYDYRSLADVLHERGYDVWLVNFRGHGAPVMYSQPPATQSDWCLDHFAAYDIPAVLDYVWRATGRKPFVIASSMGAMSLAASLLGVVIDEKAGAEAIRLDDSIRAQRHALLAGAIFVEFPAALRWPTSIIDATDRLNWGELTRHFGRAAAETNMPFELLSRSLMLHRMIERAGQVSLGWLRLNPRTPRPHGGPRPVIEAVRALQHRLIQSGLDLAGKFTGHSHHRAEIVMTARRVAFDDIKAGVLAQLAYSVRQQGFFSGLGDPRINYAEHYAQITTPLLQISGGRDRIASAAVAREVFYQAAASVDKSELYLPDFGHGEFSATPAGCERVYPTVLEWLGKRAPLRRDR